MKFIFILFLNHSFNKFQLSFFVFIFLSLWVSISSHAASYSLVGGSTAGHVSFFPGTNYKSKPHPMTAGGGFLADYSLISKLWIEVGFLYSRRGFILQSSEKTEVITLPSLQVPLLLRIFTPSPFSFGLGGYFSYALTAADLSGSLKQLDWGFVSSLGIDINLTKKINFIADLRYLFGVNTIHPKSASNTQGALRDYQFLLGIKYVN